MTLLLGDTMGEFVSALAGLWTSMTYWAGGQELPVVKRGFKSIRRYVMPIGLFAFLIILGGVWWKAIIACGLLSAATHIGYQNKWWKFSLTGLLIGAPAWILCWPILNVFILLPCLFHTLFGYISLKYNNFRWAYVALLMGVGIAIAYLTSVSLSLE